MTSGFFAGMLLLLADESFRSRIAVRFGLVLSVFLLFPALTQAAGPVKYVSLKKSEAFLREGPTYKHRVLWVYKRKGFPLQVIAEYDTWRRVKDVDGAVGWIHDTLLSNQRTALVTGKGRVSIRAKEDIASKAVAFADPGVILELKGCKASACEVEASDGTDGWIDRTRIWGVNPGEVF
jgi:SH3-like domain-containing protein